MFKFVYVLQIPIPIVIASKLSKSLLKHHPQITVCFYPAFDILIFDITVRAQSETCNKCHSNIKSLFTIYT